MVTDSALDQAEMPTSGMRPIISGIAKLPYSSSSFDVWDALDITDEDQTTVTM